MARSGSWFAARRRKAPEALEILRLAANGRSLCPRAIVAALGQRGFRRLLIEGGARTISSFIDAGCVHRLHVLIAPLILGSGKLALDLKPIDALSEAMRPTTQTYVLFDGEVLFDCDRPPLGGPG